MREIFRSLCWQKYSVGLVIVYFFLGLIATGCAGSAPEQKAGQQNPANQNQTSEGSDLTPCGSNGFTNNSSQVLNLNQLTTSDSNRQPESICQTLAREGKSVGIFQIAGVYCSTCQDDASYVRQQNLQGVAHVIVFTDNPNELQPGEERNFFESKPIAVGPYRFDAGLSLFRTLSPGKADQFGTTLVASMSGEYRVFIRENQEQQWVAAARELQAKLQHTN